MNKKDLNRCIFALAVFFPLLALLSSCRYSPSMSKSTFDRHIAVLENPESAEALHREQAYFVDSLDIESLYTSPLRDKYITAWVASFASPDSLPVYCEKLLGRLAEKETALFKPFVADICRILKIRGADQTAVTIASLPYGIDAGQNPEIAGRLLVSTLLPGQKAPAIAGTDGRNLISGSAGRRILLLFHESTCRTCGGIIWNLKQHYGELQKADVRIITVSTDTDAKIWTEYAATLPWQDKLCDYRGFYSPGIIAYGVAATPTLYLIDKEGKVTDQFTTFDDIYEVIRNEQ